VTNIFILEDDLNRIEWFRKKLGRDNSLTFCDNVLDAKLAIKMKLYSVVFLDHDLGGKQMVDSEDSNTGYQFAKFLREENIHFDQIFIHTLNPAGRENIYNLVQGLAPVIQKIPFTLLINSF